MSIGCNYLNRPKESEIIFALEMIIHPESGDDSDKEKAISVAINALRYVLHEIKSE